MACLKGGTRHCSRGRTRSKGPESGPHGSPLGKKEREAHAIIAFHQATPCSTIQDHEVLSVRVVGGCTVDCSHSVDCAGHVQEHDRLDVSDQVWDRDLGGPRHS
ncbi:hypothetical protein PC113_g17137 [Phytophthora cactorum]|uniref:Uncharacterized protein n=1 Tax=Phytophthora cactorum TaxID=29920 RepID=A0A8T0YT12_9STRA|nr:hypothetical protein PC113_g17137 [Phytophthora cactorum]KAG2922482.1 hypothetical protein PC117_g15954 [Phytophthora cactorum]KAG3075544.1 hypothetical protein PC121_g7996 [Phytophthora cactorum]KAG3080109.1 hypothetical protein PC122_g11931 [Phytophthora cactorum]KAG3149516.1 hypothetical protein C6341_g17014 [Phytophthora cactorum]